MAIRWSRGAMVNHIYYRGNLQYRLGNVVDPVYKSCGKAVEAVSCGAGVWYKKDNNLNQVRYKGVTECHCGPSDLVECFFSNR